MKALVGAFNQEKALVGAFSVIVQPVVEPMDWFAALAVMHQSDYDDPHLTRIAGLQHLADRGLWVHSERVCWGCLCWHHWDIRHSHNQGSTISCKGMRMTSVSVSSSCWAGQAWAWWSCWSRTIWGPASPARTQPPTAGTLTRTWTTTPTLGPCTAPSPHTPATAWMKSW